MPDSRLKTDAASSRRPGPGSLAAPLSSDRRRDRPKPLRALAEKLHSLLQRATGRALLGTLVGNIPGFFLPFAIAARMHIGHLTDAYAFALGIAILASGLCAGVIQPNALPVLQRMKDLGRAAFVGRLRTISLQAACITGFLYAAIGFLSLAYIDHNTHWTSQQQTLLVGATLIFSVFVLASAVNAALSAGLNALDAFLNPAASQALKSIMPLAAVPFVARDTRGLLIIAALLAIGELMRTLALIYQLRKATLSLPALRAPEGYAGELPLWRAAAPAALSLLISGASPLIDRAVAAPLSAGSVTYIDLGERVFQVPLTIISTSLLLVAATRWSAIRRTDVPLLRRDLRRTLVRGNAVCLAMLVGLMGVLAVIAMVAGTSLVGGSTSTLVSVVALLLAGLPAAYIVMCGAWFITSTRTTYLLPALGIVYFVTNLGFDVVGAQILGVEGIALSSTLCRCFNALLYLIVMKRLLATEFRGLSIWPRGALPVPDSDRNPA